MFANNRNMAKYKPITDHEDAALRFLSDLEGDGIITYDIADFSSGALPSVYPTSYLDKCSHATVALSGCAPEAQDYMVICPYRVDRDSDVEQMVYDIDPLILTLDANTADPYPVAIIGYHQKFPGRTTPIAGFSYTDIETTVVQLRKDIVTVDAPLDEIPAPVEQGLHHMAKYLRKHYGITP